MGRRLSEGTIRLGARVASAGPHEVRLESGETIGGDAVVVATDAQPEQRPGALEPVERPVRLESGLFVCGDHRDTASLHGAMLSGRRAAEAVLAGP
jgi:hypothetical protein